MPGWQNSDRRQFLPPNWPQLREQRFKIDGYRCTAMLSDDTRCTGPAEECDHIGKRTDHRIEKLRSLCSWHHARKSSREGAMAKAKILRANSQKFRRTEAHPGL